jgi:mitochondrial GTPase 1
MAGRRVYASAPKPGVTKALKWATIAEGVDLLDAPGVLPMRIDDQVSATRLAMVNDIGEASYVAYLVAAALAARLRCLPQYECSIRPAMCARWGIPDEELDELTCEDVVGKVAARLFQHDEEKAAQRMLKDFRTLALGPVALELPPGDFAYNYH